MKKIGKSFEDASRSFTASSHRKKKSSRKKSILSDDDDDDSSSGDYNIWGDNKSEDRSSKKEESIKTDKSF